MYSTITLASNFHAGVLEGPRTFPGRCLYSLAAIEYNRLEQKASLLVSDFFSFEAFGRPGPEPAAADQKITKGGPPRARGLSAEMQQLLAECSTAALDHFADSLDQLRMPRVRTVATALGGLCCAWFLFVHPFLPRGYFAYSTRPLWDRDEAPQQVLRQYWTPDLAPADRCRLHGWTARDEETQVWDAVRAASRPALVKGY